MLFRSYVASTDDCVILQQSYTPPYSTVVKKIGKLEMDVLSALESPLLNASGWIELR